MSPNGPLLVLGLLVVTPLAGIATLGDLRVHTGGLLLLWGTAHGAYLAAAWLVTRQPRAPGNGIRTHSLTIILALALVPRLFLIPCGPTLSEDVYRYLWDGRLVANGINPFPHPPRDPALAPFHDDLLDRLNHPDVPTVYPPSAQLFFGAVAKVAARPEVFKAALLPVEIALWIALAFLLRRRGLPAERLLLFAWNPLVIVESYASGHLDLLTAAFLTLALATLEAKRMASAGVAFAVAALTKYTPLLLLPYLARRRATTLLACAALTGAFLFVPFLGAGESLWTGLRLYAGHWEFNGSLYQLLRGVIASDATVRRVLAALLAAATLWISWRARTATGAAAGILSAYVVASPTVFPWYLLPIVALLPLHAHAGLLVFSGLVALSYLPLTAYHARGAWSLPAWIPWVEYGGLAAVTAAAAWAGRRRAQARRAAWARESTPT